jgi:hypothetical protein
MNPKKTARDVPSRELLPLIAQFLKEHGLAKPIQKLAFPESELVEFESWVLNQVANVLLQLYLYPSLVISGFAVKRGSNNKECRLIRKLQHLYVARLIETQWIVKDRTGIFYLPDSLSNDFDSFAQSLSQ